MSDEESLRLVRICWRGGKASARDVMWVRSVSELVSAAPVHVAMKYLRSWEDLVLGFYSEQTAARIIREAESRGHAAEIPDYTPSYIASALGCSAMAEETLRVTFLPSFHPEGVLTARRAADAWQVELRISRESIWYTRFAAIPFAHWPDVRRHPGHDVIVKQVARDVAIDAERLLLVTLESPTASPLRGVDGMNVHVSSRLAGVVFDDEGWCPQVGTHIRAAADLALLLATSDEATEWMTAIRRYL